MKKLMLAIFLIILLYVFIGRVSSLAIPDDALRIRVIANSNSDYDQEIKKIVKENIQYKLYELLKNTKGIDQARKIINNNLNDIDNNVKETLQLLNYELGYDINFGLNYFPSKEYKGVTYDEGYYESLVITLGEGKGDNWWCVLFPPLCLLEAEESTEVEYTSFVKELLDKYL
ncbi:MAG TPA: stage II sporulation protein R [Candidatus Faecisoma merdavium]|nr:stage II sporulation protein R [Candidatus Faecisoma merdavium]